MLSCLVFFIVFLSTGQLIVYFILLTGNLFLKSTECFEMPWNPSKKPQWKRFSLTLPKSYWNSLKLSEANEWFGNPLKFLSSFTEALMEATGTSKAPLKYLEPLLHPIRSNPLNSPIQSADAWLGIFWTTFFFVLLFIWLGVFVQCIKNNFEIFLLSNTVSMIGFQ